MRARKSDKPLCLLIGTNWPHVPWPAESGYDPASITLPPTHVDTPKTREVRSRYYAAVANADEHLRKILQAAREHLDPSQTYFFFTSDHGAQLPFSSRVGNAPVSMGSEPREVIAKLHELLDARE